MWRATRQYKFIVLLLSLLLAAAGVQAQTELVDNGDFETGTFDNWTYSYTGGAEFYCYTDWVIESDDTDCIQPYFGPLAGNYSAVNSFDGPAMAEFHLYQDITIPAGSDADLSFMYRVQYYNDEVFPWNIARPFYVQVRDPESNAILATLYTYLTNVPPECCGTRESAVDNETKFDTGLVNVGPLDMSAWAGQTVRLYFYELVPEFFTGGSVISLDNISVLASPSAPPQRNVVVAEASLLAWGQITWATGYEVQIDNDANFSSAAYVNAALAVNEITVPELTAGLYYWRVRAQRANGSWGGWSQVDSFVVAPAP